MNYMILMILALFLSGITDNVYVIMSTFIFAIILIIILIIALYLHKILIKE